MKVPTQKIESNKLEFEYTKATESMKAKFKEAIGWETYTPKNFYHPLELI